MLNGITGFSSYNYYNAPAGNSLSGSNYTDSMSGAVPDDKSARSQENGRPGKVDSAGECQTCKSRKYQDGSNENVSFKSAAHISPKAAAGAVRAHEGEHVSNAYSKAAQNNGKVINASVAIHTSVCPECGRTYVSGGTTSTTIKYSNEENPYVQNLKAQQSEAFKGQYIDFAA